MEFESKNEFVKAVYVKAANLSNTDFCLEVVFNTAPTNTERAEFGIREHNWAREMILSEGNGLFSYQQAIGLAKLLTAEI